MRRKAVDAILEVNGTMFICADHGNAEQLVDYETGAPFTAHTTIRFRSFLSIMIPHIH